MFITLFKHTNHTTWLLDNTYRKRVTTNEQMNITTTFGMKLTHEIQPLSQNFLISFVQMMGQSRFVIM